MDLRSGPTIGTSRKAFWQLGPNRRSKCREWGPKRQAPGVGGCSLVFQRWNHLCHASAMQRLCGVMYLFIIWSDVKMHRQIDAHAAGFCVELKSCRSNLDTAKALKCRLTRPIEASNNHILENCESQYHFSSFFSQRYSLPSHMSLRRPTSRYPTSLYLVDDLIHKTTKFWTVFFCGDTFCSQHRKRASLWLQLDLEVYGPSHLSGIGTDAACSSLRFSGFTGTSVCGTSGLFFTTKKVVTWHSPDSHSHRISIEYL
jgi:hypothetical protein